MRNEKYIGYEYINVTVNDDMGSLCADGYQSFGWELEGHSPSLHLHSTSMKFKRDRKLRNKAELTRLQRQFESCVKAIESLNMSKMTNASIVAYVVGILGTACMAGATFAFLAGMIPLMIILAVPGFIGWIIPYFSFKSLCRKRAEKVAPLIEQKYDEIYDVCEKANALLA